VPGGVSGLGLVRALLPRRSATLALEQQGDEVVATRALRRPACACCRDGRCRAMAMAAHNHAPEHAARRWPGSKGRILVVDDDRLVLATVATAWRRPATR
jgi:hypothetical protein